MKLPKRIGKRAMSHPALKRIVDEPSTPSKSEKKKSFLTPLSRKVAIENLNRDQFIGEAYALRREELEKGGKLYDVDFTQSGPLGFKILLARGAKSTRRRVIVDETFEYCEAYHLLRPNDEIIAVQGDLLIEMDPEAFGELVRRLRSLRPLRLTFAKGDGRQEAFQRQCDEREETQHLTQTKALVATIESHGLTGPLAYDDGDDDDLDDLDDLPHEHEEEEPSISQTTPDVGPLPYCGAICVGVTLSCDCTAQQGDATPVKTRKSKLKDRNYFGLSKKTTKPRATSLNLNNKSKVGLAARTTQ